MPGTEFRRQLRLFGLWLLAWTAFGLFFFSQGLTQKFLFGEPTPWWHFLVSWLTGVYIMAILTPGVLWLGRRFPFSRRNWLRRTGLHLACSLLFATVQILSESALLHRFGVFPNVMRSFPATVVFLFVLGFHQNITTYWLILGIQYAVRYYRAYQERERDALRLELRTSELKTQLAHAHLSTLKMQLQPHFLFNTLNAIMVLVRQRKPNEAEEMLGRLSDLLRCVLEDVEAQEVPLRRELQYLKLYLAIEEVRFRDRLRVEIAADTSTLDAAFPHMGLQPLVENAIRHGIGRSSTASKIRIVSCRSGDTLKIAVEDDGPGLEADFDGVPGIGLANTRARLRELYGDEAELTLENHPNGGAIATVVLPFRSVDVLSDAEVYAFHDSDRR